MSYPILFTTKSAERAAAIANIAIATQSIAGDSTGADESYVSPDTLDLDSQGQGTLSDALTCEVTEERNGSYELEMTYPINGIHFDEIETRAFLLAQPNYTDDPQLFRIYKITKPLNGVCTIYAQHVSYDMSGYYLPGGLTAASLTAAVTLLNSYCSPFTIASTKTGSSSFSTDVPASVRSWLGGKSGSFLDLYGGEWAFDNFTATLSTARGSNRGVTIRYGKNLTSFEHEEDASNLYTAVRAYYKDNDGNLTLGTAVSTGLTLDTDRVYLLDRSSAYQSDDAPDTSDLTQDATDYIDANNLTVPAENIKLDFVQLQGLSERVDLCDTVTIQWEEMGVSATAKCIETTWDVLKERYTSCTFGTARSTLADTVNGIITAANESLSYIRGNIANTQSTLEDAIENATQTITGNQGGYVVVYDSDDDGYPDEILIMDDDDIASATNVWRWNLSGLGYSSTGYSATGGYTLAMTMDGEINASMITTGEMSANRISGGTLKLGGYNGEHGLAELYNPDDNLELQLRYDGMRIYNDGAFLGSIRSSHYTDTTFNAIVIAGYSTADSVDIQFYDSTYSTYYTRYRFYDAQADGFKILADKSTGGKVTCRLSTQSYGGESKLYNLSGTLRVTAAVSSGDNGYLELTNSSDVVTNFLGCDSNGYGGRNTIYNSSGSTRAVYGVSSADAGFLTLYNTSSNATLQLGLSNSAGWISLNNSSGTYRFRMGVNSYDNGWLSCFNTNGYDTVRLLSSNSTNGGLIYVCNSSGTSTITLQGEDGYIYMLDEDSNSYRIRAVMKTSVSTTINSYGNADLNLAADTYTVLSARTSNGSSAVGAVLTPFAAYGNWWVRCYDWLNDTKYTSGSITVYVYYIKQV